MPRRDFRAGLGAVSSRSAEEALAIASRSEFGLHAIIVARDINRAVSLARRIPRGRVSVNRFTEGDIKIPFDGYRRSGSLVPDTGIEALDQFHQTKTIWIDIAAPLEPVRINHDSARSRPSPRSV